MSLLESWLSLFRFRLVRFTLLRFSFLRLFLFRLSFLIVIRDMNTPLLHLRVLKFGREFVTIDVELFHILTSSEDVETVNVFYSKPCFEKFMYLPIWFRTMCRSFCSHNLTHRRFFLYERIYLTLSCY